MSLVLSEGLRGLGDHTTPPIPVPGSRDGKATMTVVARKALTQGAVEPIALGGNGWEIPATRPAGTGDFLYVGVVLEPVAANRTPASGSRQVTPIRKRVGERITVQVAGLYRGATLPSTLTDTDTNKYIGYTGGSSALAVSGNPRNDAVFAESVSARGAGTSKDLRLFGRPIHT